MDSSWLQIAALVIPLVFAIVFHEVAHGLAARALGDPTAHDARRLSLNPLRHVDPFGTIILPGMLKLVGLPPIGYAKPVPVDMRRLRNPRRDMMLVAAAGPGSNLVMAIVGAVLLGLLARSFGDVGNNAGVVGFIALNLFYFLQINIFLALFNLLPIPPFDGSHIVEGLLPRDLARSYARMRQLGFALVLLVLVVLPWAVPGLDIIGHVVIPPVSWLLDHYLSLADAVAGHG